MDKKDNAEVALSARVWESVDRNAAPVKTWPEWKRRGSGVLRSLAASDLSRDTKSENERGAGTSAEK